MLFIYLSDQAQRDLKRYHNEGIHGLNALENALARFDSIQELQIETRVPRNHEIKRLKCKPTAWRVHDGDNRIIFTASSVWNSDSIQVLRVAPRDKVYRGLENYLDLNEHDAKLWNNPNINEDALLDREYSEAQAQSRYRADPRYKERSKLRILQLKGSAGSGKTTVSLQLAINAIEQGAYPILIVPNRSMQQSCQNFILQENPNLRICLNLPDRPSYLSTEKSESETFANLPIERFDMALFSKDYFMQLLAGDIESVLSRPLGLRLIRQAFYDHRIEIPKNLENLDLYSLYLGTANELISYQNESKDPLLKEFEQTGALEFINNPNHRRLIEKALQKKDALSQIYCMQKRWEDGDWERFREIMTDLTVQPQQAKIDLTQTIAEDINGKESSKVTHPILIIDEVQDFYWGQLKAIFRFYSIMFPMNEPRYQPTQYRIGDELKVSWNAVTENQGRLIILAGDNNQRIVFSGFNWAGFAQTFRYNFPNSIPPYTPDAFNKNYRNTAKIARVANYFLSSQHTELRAFDIGTDNISWIDAPPEPENCIHQGGQKPLLIQIDDQWLEKLVQHLSQGIDVLEERERFIFIDRITDEERHSFWNKLGVAKLSQEGDGQKVYWASIEEAKGREFQAVTLVYPFSDCSNHPKIYELFSWYTSLTRSREYLALLISKQEMQWLQENVRSIGELGDICRIETSISPEVFAHELLKEGRDTISLEQELEDLVDHLIQKIQNWLSGGSEYLTNLSEPLTNKGYNVWDILDLVETRNETIEAVNLQLLSLEGFSMHEALLIYVAILPLVMNWPCINALDQQILRSLEEYIPRASNQDKESISAYLGSDFKKGSIGRCLIYRARWESWNAAKAIEHYPDSQVSRFLYQQISQDLEDRGLPWDAARLRHLYLREVIDQRLPFHKLLGDSGDLPDLLINKILDQVDQFMHLTKENN